MAFFQFSDDTRSQFDLPTQKQLQRLAKKFGTVELCEITESKEWCVRIVIVDEADERLPLAALGATPYEAAERLIRISQIRD